MHINLFPRCILLGVLWIGLTACGNKGELVKPAAAPPAPVTYL